MKEIMIEEDEIKNEENEDNKNKSKKEPKNTPAGENEENLKKPKEEPGKDDKADRHRQGVCDRASGNAPMLDVIYSRSPHGDHAEYTACDKVSRNAQNAYSFSFFASAQIKEQADQDSGRKADQGQDDRLLFQVTHCDPTSLKPVQRLLNIAHISARHPGRASVVKSNLYGSRDRKIELADPS